MRAAEEAGVASSDPPHPPASGGLWAHASVGSPASLFLVLFGICSDFDSEYDFDFGCDYVTTPCV